VGSQNTQSLSLSTAAIALKVSPTTIQAKSQRHIAKHSAAKDLRTNLDYKEGGLGTLERAYTQRVSSQMAVNE